MRGASLPFSIACGVSSSSIRASPRSFLWPTPNERRKSHRKARCAPITAQFELKPPPYPLDSLEPHMSRETVEHHWGRHHRGHVDALNTQIGGTQLEDMELEDVVITSYNQGSPLPPFVHAALVWNHDFFWQSMKPGGGGKPSGRCWDALMLARPSTSTARGPARARALAWTQVQAQAAMPFSSLQCFARFLVRTDLSTGDQVITNVQLGDPTAARERCRIGRPALIRSIICMDWVDLSMDFGTDRADGQSRRVLHSDCD